MGNDETKRSEQIARGIYHLFLGNAASTFLVALAAVVVARILGPSEYGLYTIALIIPPVLFTSARLGVDAAATRYGSRLRSEGRDVEATAFVYSSTIFGLLAASPFVVIFLAISGQIAGGVLHRPDLAAVALPLGVISVVGQAVYTTASQGLTGLGRFRSAGALQALQGATRLVVAVTLVALGYGVVGAIAGYTTAFEVSGILGLLLVARLAGVLYPRSIWADVRTALRYGFPVYISTMATGFYVPAINTILAAAVSNQEVGGYAAALTFNTLVLLITYPISQALFPLFSRKVDDPKLLAETYASSLKFTALLVVPLSAFLIVFSRDLMVSFYSGSFAFGAGYLALTASVSLLAGIGSTSFAPLLNGIGHTRDALVATLSGSILAVFSAYLLIQSYGVAGAIVGQFLGGVLTLALGSWAVKQRLGSRLGLSGVLGVYAAAAASAVVCIPVALTIANTWLALVVGGGLMILVYVPSLALLRALNKEDLGSLRAQFSFSPTVSRILELLIRFYEAASRIVG